MKFSVIGNWLANVFPPAAGWAGQSEPTERSDGVILTHDFLGSARAKPNFGILAPGAGTLSMDTIAVPKDYIWLLQSASMATNEAAGTNRLGHLSIVEPLAGSDHCIARETLYGGAAVDFEPMSLHGTRIFLSEGMVLRFQVDALTGGKQFYARFVYQQFKVGEYFLP
jgi:hypothetical protein